MWEKKKSATKLVGRGKGKAIYYLTLQAAQRKGRKGGQRGGHFLGGVGAVHRAKR